MKNGPGMREMLFLKKTGYGAAIERGPDAGEFHGVSPQRNHSFQNRRGILFQGQTRPDDFL